MDINKASKVPFEKAIKSPFEKATKESPINSGNYEPYRSNEDLEKDLLFVYDMISTCHTRERGRNRLGTIINRVRAK
jgi:hypothetical protein